MRHRTERIRPPLFDADILESVLPAARHALASGVRGVLGQDFLSAFNYTLDYRRRRLIGDEPGDVNWGRPPGAARLRERVVQHA